jgi:RimJ/RimL family protein N-acetyltransferase
MPSFPNLHQPLTGAVAELRLAAERDIPEILIAHQDDPQLYARMGMRRPPSGAELGRRVEESAPQRAAGTGVWLTILRAGVAGPSECAGQIDVHGVDWDHARAELRIWVAPALRGQGLGADALRLVARWLLTECGLVRVQLLTDPGNEAMRRAAQAAGFAQEGVLRSYVRERGQRVDAAMLAMIAADLVTV